MGGCQPSSDAPCQGKSLIVMRQLTIGPDDKGLTIGAPSFQKTDGRCLASKPSVPEGPAGPPVVFYNRMRSPRGIGPGVAEGDDFPGSPGGPRRAGRCQTAKLGSWHSFAGPGTHGKSFHAWVAQKVERQIEDLRAGGSIPSPGTKGIISDIYQIFRAVSSSGKAPCTQEVISSSLISSSLIQSTNHWFS